MTGANHKIKRPLPLDETDRPQEFPFQEVSSILYKVEVYVMSVHHITSSDSKYLTHS